MSEPEHDGPGESRRELGFLSGGGTMGAWMRRFDWAATALGPAAGWPQSLKAAIRIMLSSRYAMWMAWGHELTFFCNDAYLPTVGLKRDWVLGARSDRVWEEIWPDIGPRIERVLATGEATWDEALLLFLERSGFREETYHTFSYSPLADDAGIITGMLCVVTEETERVVGERRLRVLRDLGQRLADVRTAAEVWRAVELCVAGEPQDLPFVLGYAFVDGGAALMSCTGLPAGHAAAMVHVVGDESAWPLARLREEGRAIELDDLARPWPGLPPGAWDRPPGRALLMPLAARGQERAVGALVAGLNPYRPLDGAYHGFLDLFVGQVAAALANADAYATARRRAEALAEIDRAKTAFFSNISHEFRTPLTLMLGPLEDVLNAPEADAASSRPSVEIAHRNGLRLLRLVNGLLDFSRIEAGRTQASFEATDLARLTAELASSFRAATDRAGLRLSIECPPLPEAVFVDRAMWETIVLNLLSNAFKFTFEGEIAVRLRVGGGQVHLVVQDTGTGIPAAELPRLFDRFHRVAGAKGRSFEGSGIGLALVQELARLHHGDIAVESTPGVGTAFTVTIPEGSAHLPPEQVVAAHGAGDGASPARAQSFVEEAMRWLPEQAAGPMGRPLGAARGRVLLADDNADLRAYITRLLTEDGFAVTAVGDGEAALAAMRESRPELLVTDVMMPGLDGVGLLRAVRGDAGLQDVPVIMLSARAGEEARVEGLSAGADDYLTKPFSARELLARVSGVIAMAQARRESTAALAESEARFRTMADHAPVMMWVTDAEGACTYLNQAWYAFTGQSADAAAGDGWLAAIHPEDRAAMLRTARGAAPPGERRVEYRLRQADGSYRWMLDASVPRSGVGAFLGSIGSVIDIDDRKEAESVLERRVAAAIEGRAQAEEALRQAQKMEAVGQLTGGIAHDFNNLLTVITGNIGITSRALDQLGIADARARRGLENANRGAERAAALTHRLLAFSRRQSLAPSSTDVDRLLSGMADLLHRSLGEVVQLEIITTPGLWRVEVDQNQLESAVLNLALNARDAMPGGGQLTIETANAWLDEGYAANHAEVSPGAYVVIAVTDTGSGMSRETLNRVFEPFFTTKEVGKGTGLGLSMVYGFTKQSGGHIKVYSEPGRGTTVKIYLPRLLSGAEREVESAPALHPIVTRRNQTVLVVEDDAEVRAYTGEILRELGYRVIEAHDGPAALQTLARADAKLDLLFTDVVMPGMSGGELAERARAIRPGLKVLFTSGYTRNAIVHGGRLDSGVEMIAKPFTYHALGEKIADVLELGTSGRVLLVSGDAVAWRAGAEALATAGYAVDQAATPGEALGRVRAARGGYDAVIVSPGPGETADSALVAEMRALHADLPIVITGARATVAGDRWMAAIPQPYSAGQLQAALAGLGVRSRAG